MPKCDFNKVAKQIFSNHTSAWEFFCKCVVHFLEHLFIEHLWTTASVMDIVFEKNPWNF